jgi:carbamoyl-phosphate synthase large subunit
MKYNVLLEASGSLTSSYMIKAVKNAGATVTASDIAECAAQQIADDFIFFPLSSVANLWNVIETEITNRKINVVIPSFDETLIEWAEKKDYFRQKGVHVILSNKETIAKCQDKWETYQFFKAIGIPTPETSTENKYPLIKPRLGRGGKGIAINSSDKNISMDGMISQELLEGQEYTIDVFCDNESNPVYIIPRKRMQVKDGKSINGITIIHEGIITFVKKICSHLKFIGPINIQCFETVNGEIKFIEINPRIAGGMALGFAASENWVELIFKNIIENKAIQPVQIKYDLKMFRHYDEVFTN